MKAIDTLRTRALKLIDLEIVCCENTYVKFVAELRLKTFQIKQYFQKTFVVYVCVFAKIFFRVLFCFASSSNDSKLKRARQNMRVGVKIKHSLRLSHTHAKAYAATGEMRRISVYCTLLCKHIERNADADDDDDDADAGCRLELSLSLSLCKLAQKLVYDLDASLMSVELENKKKRREQIAIEILP